MKRFLKSALIAFALVAMGGYMYDAYTIQQFRIINHVSDKPDINPDGLEKLNASGSKLPRLTRIKPYLKHAQGPIYVVDLMHEDHTYIQGIPSTYFGFHHTQGDKGWLKQTRYKLRWLLMRFLTWGATPQHISEAEESQRQNLHYKELKIMSKWIPDSEQTQQVIDFVQSLPQEAWIHAHCKNGKGRTSLFLVMLDIIRNAPNVSLEDIVARHHAAGSENLLDTTVWENGTYSQEQLTTRRAFIEEFYHEVTTLKAEGALAL